MLALTRWVPARAGDRRRRGRDRSPAAPTRPRRIRFGRRERGSGGGQASVADGGGRVARRVWVSTIGVFGSAVGAAAVLVAVRRRARRAGQPRWHAVTV